MGFSFKIEQSDEDKQLQKESLHDSTFIDISEADIDRSRLNAHFDRKQKVIISDPRDRGSSFNKAGIPTAPRPEEGKKLFALNSWVGRIALAVTCFLAIGVCWGIYYLVMVFINVF